MIDITTYRQKIGSFSQKLGIKNIKRGNKLYSSGKKQTKTTLFMIFQFLLRIILVLLSTYQENIGTYQKVLQEKNYNEETNLQKLLFIKGFFPEENYCREIKNNFRGTVQEEDCRWWNYTTFEGGTPNFQAKYTYGNKQAIRRGIKNMHLNIRSLRNKVPKLKHLIKQHKPHVFGISEFELKNWIRENFLLP